MDRAKKWKMGHQSIGSAVVLGVAVGIGIVLMAAALIATLVATERMEIGDIGFASGAALFLSAFVAGLLAANRAGKQRWLVALLTAGSMLLLLLCGNAVFLGGAYADVGVTTLLMLGAGAAAALIRRQERAMKGKKKYRI